MYQPVLAYHLFDEGGVINARRMTEAMDWELFHPVLFRFEDYARRTGREQRDVKRCLEREQERERSTQRGEVLLECAPSSTGHHPGDVRTGVDLDGPLTPPGALIRPPGRPRRLAAGLLRAFVLSPFYEVPQNAEAIERALRRNPAFLELCNFSKSRPPSARTLRRFDQLMRESGLWGEVRRLLVEGNLTDGVIQSEEYVAVDTTRHDAFGEVRKLSQTAREAREKAEAAGQELPEPGPEDYTCDVTEVVAKSACNRRPGVKSGFISLPGSELPIVGMAFAGNEPDNHTLSPILERFRDEHPRLAAPVKGVLADGIYNTTENHRQTAEVLPGASLFTPVHPGARKDRFLPERGMAFMSKYGVPHCIMGHPMELAGRDLQKKEFIWVCPVFNPQCGVEGLTCDKKDRCCPRACNGRVYRVPAETTPQINWDHPQFAKRTKKKYDLRTSVERVFGRGKRVLPFERLYNRGKAAFQGFLDRMVIAFHLFARAACRLGRPDLMRSVQAAIKPTS